MLTSCYTCTQWLRRKVKYFTNYFWSYNTKAVHINISPETRFVIDMSPGYGFVST